MGGITSAGKPVDWFTTGFPRTGSWLGAFVPLAVFKLVRLCPSLAFLTGFTSLYVRLLLILCVTGYCEIFILFRNPYKLGYDHYGQRIVGVSY